MTPMKSLLIKDTTVSERAQIVREALGAEADCEGIDLSDINREFSERHAGSVVPGDTRKAPGCAMR